MRRALSCLIGVLAISAAGMITAATAATVEVTQQGLTFVPSTVTISPGDIVRWIWTSGVHTTTSGTGPGDPQHGVLWDGPLNSSNTTFEHQFNTTGSFDYYCAFHFLSGMTGTVEVTDDIDGDGVPDASDNCPTISNPSQTNNDGDAFGAACDCDDTDPDIFPGASEFCNGVDDDCDGTADNNPVDGSTWYPDLDGDGFGAPTGSVTACSQPSGFVANSLDCDDTQGSVHPGATEFCNGLDDDCNGTIDDNAVDPATWYPDLDGDGFGAATGSVAACTQPPGFVDNSLDCDDAQSSVNPNADELCNGIDDNCDGTIDNDPVDATTWYPDLDGDGFGAPTGSVTDCTQPPGFVGNNLDCVDTQSSVHPGAVEVCNGIDDDCDGTIDNNPTDGTTWYPDFDGDGFGTGAGSITACSQPSGFVGNNFDCDDTQGTVHPGATEICNGIDDDCDGNVDFSGCCDCPFQSDFDEDGFRTAIDLGELIDILFAGHPDVQDPNCPSPRADFDCDGFSTALDLSGLIDHLFAGGNPPCDPCNP